MLRKQALTAKARKIFAIPRGDPFTAEPRSPGEVFLDARLSYALESCLATALHGGMSALVGESGAGKSVLRRTLLDRLRRGTRPVVPIQPYVVGMDDDARGRPLRAEHIAEAVLRELAPSARFPRSPEARFRALHKALKESARAGSRHVLIIEEAHDLHAKTLKQLKRFHELEEGFDRLIAILLFGQTEIKAKLSENNAGMRELVQRLDLVEIPPLADPAPYARHRLAACSVEFDRVFAPGALDALKKGKKSPLYPLALGNALTAGMNLAAELGMDKVTGDVLARI